MERMMKKYECYLINNEPWVFIGTNYGAPQFERRRCIVESFKKHERIDTSAPEAMQSFAVITNESAVTDLMMSSVYNQVGKHAFYIKLETSYHGNGLVEYVMDGHVFYSTTIEPHENLTMREMMYAVKRHEVDDGTTDTKGGEL